MMINTLQIIYDYDENDGILPSGMPRGHAYCHQQCSHIDRENNRCLLFNEAIDPVFLGKDGRQAFIPADNCRHHEMQGR